MRNFGGDENRIEEDTSLSSLHDLIQMEEWELLEQLLEEHPQQAAVKIEFHLFAHRTVGFPIFAALRKPSVPLSTIQAILKAHPRAARCKESITGGLPLHAALQSNFCSADAIDIVNMLVAADASALEVADMDGNLPLHLAANRATSDVTLFLLDANPTCALVRNKKGQIPLHKAVGRCDSHLEVVQALFKTYSEGALVSDSSGRLALHLAALWRGGPELFKLLLSVHPEAVHVKDMDGNTPYRLMARLRANHEVCDQVRRTMQRTGNQRQRAVATVLNGMGDSGGFSFVGPGWSSRVRLSSSVVAEVPGPAKSACSRSLTRRKLRASRISIEV